MKKIIAIVGATLAAILFSGSVPSSPYNSILEREIQKLTERGLRVQLLGEVVEATDPISGQKWQFSAKMLTPREPAYTGLPTLTIDLRTLDTNQYYWKYRFHSQAPVSTVQGYALPIADLDSNGLFETYGIYYLDQIEAGTMVYELDDNKVWQRRYRYPGAIGVVDNIADLDGNSLVELQARYGDSMRVFESQSPIGLPLKPKFQYRMWYFDATGIPSEVADMNSDGSMDLIYRGSQEGIPTTSENRNYVAQFDSSINNLSVIWSAHLPPYDTTCLDFCTLNMSAGKFDDDEKKDFVTSAFSGKVYIVEQVFGDSFAVSWTDSISVAGRVASGDVDGNGIEEFFVAGNQIENDGLGHMRMYAYERVGDNSFVPFFSFDIFPVGLFFVDLHQTVDIDGDGRKELLISFGGGNIIIKSTGTHQYNLFYYKKVSGSDGFSAADIDHDGYAELFMSRWNNDGTGLYTHTDVYSPDSLLTPVETENVGTSQTVTLFELFPNPFNGIVQIRYQSLGEQKILLTVHDIVGRQVALLEDKRKIAGVYTIEWNTNSSEQGALASGIYFCRLVAGGNSLTRKMILIK